MELLGLLLGLWLSICQVQAKAVFAHFMVGNTAQFSVDDWRDDISLAQQAHIDAFALNMAYDDSTNNPQLANAFSAASSLGFKLFFSFDYAGNGAWPQNQVIDLVSKYGPNGAYYKYNSKPLVSTFEGPDNATDWNTIKKTTGCFFIPDWSSKGAKVALALGGPISGSVVGGAAGALGGLVGEDAPSGVADGLFNWAAWPVGAQDMNTYVDASYRQYLNGKPYMMPVSPWFFTNMPGYEKNWLWRGDDLWYDRWQHVNYIQPEFVQIISWNDYGESHYIGPLKDKEYVAFDIGKAPYNYVRDMPHDGWRMFLPYVIDMYKNNVSTVNQEGLVSWYRLNPKGACSDGRTAGDSASHLHVEYPPTEIVQDKVFFSALLGSAADVSVSIGGASKAAKWENTPKGGIGVYHGSVATNGATGPVVVTVSRSGGTVAQVNGKAITTSCTNGINNFNAWVGSAQGGASGAKSQSLDEQVCVEGFGVYNFDGLCQNACKLGYCPLGACTCSLMGPPEKRPKETNDPGFPIAGEDANYSGLCSFNCNYGYCPPTACGHTEVPLSIATVSPFLPPACTAGKGEGGLAGLCDFSCHYGYCPIHSCSCSSKGVLVPTPAPNSTTDGCKAAEGVVDDGLCKFAGKFGYCPPGPCIPPPRPVEDNGPGAEADAKSSSLVDCTLFDPPNRVATLSKCHAVCGDALQKAADAGELGSVTCAAKRDSHFVTGPDGVRVETGTCSCNNSFINALAETFLEALPLIAEVGCELLMSAVKIVGEIGVLAIPGVGEAIDGGMIAAIEAAKLSSYAMSSGADALEGFSEWLNPCGNTELPPDLQKVFDILDTVDAAILPKGFRPPKGLPKGGSKPGSKSGDKPQTTSTRDSCPGNRKRAADDDCNDPKHVTSIEKSSSVEKTIKIKCEDEFYTQPCYHYLSAIDNGKKAEFTCYDDAVRQQAPYVKSWSDAHKADWYAYTTDSYHLHLKTSDRDEAPDCDADEWPPAYFLPDPELRDKGQVIRWMPAGENRGAGGLWGGFCKSEDGGKGNGQTKGGAINKDLVKLGKSLRTKKNGDTTTTYYEAEYTRAVFSMTFDAAFKAGAKGKKYGLEANPCWPKDIVPNDPGFPLLTDDKWYDTAPKKVQDQRPLYKDPPPREMVEAAQKLRGQKRPPPDSDPDNSDSGSNKARRGTPDLQLVDGGLVVREGNLTRRLTRREMRRNVEVIPCADRMCSEERRNMSEDEAAVIIPGPPLPVTPTANLNTVPTTLAVVPLAAEIHKREPTLPDIALATKVVG